ncbi:MAG: SEC-C metal-binding domain-containing protein [Methanomicrobiales archaeon]|nr:SEC-C metal-binding domain-containing protein [Methanomicrobiales archaeon]
MEDDRNDDATSFLIIGGPEDSEGHPAPFIEPRGDMLDVEDVYGEVRPWFSRFRRSNEFRGLSHQQKSDAEEIIEKFAMGMNAYFEKWPITWDEPATRKCCLEVFPEKLAATSEWFAAVAPVLTAFFRFLVRKDILPKVSHLIPVILEIGPDIERNGMDPAMWGNQKRYEMKQSPSTPFMGLHNTSLMAQLSGILTKDVDRGDIRGTPVLKAQKRQGPRIGRNAACPCGSAKKYKHCCMKKYDSGVKGG